MRGKIVYPLLYKGRYTALPILILLLTFPAKAQRTQLKPGFNMFSPAQDVEVGKQVSADAEKQLAMLNDRRVDDYLTRLGKRLASKAPGEKYPYQFKGVNDKTINAFALPGGFLYVNRGIIESADNEAQVAGVIGHEIGHAALRHGTNQASKAALTQMPLAILGGVLGSNSIGAMLAQIGAGFGANSLLLKFSRDAERQADIIGTQILFDNGYDPRAMAQFFEKLEAETKSGRPPQFFSTHPNPENRIEVINKEIGNLGGLTGNFRTTSTEFQDIKRYVLSLPAPPKTTPAQQTTTSAKSGTARPAPPSNRYQTLNNDLLRMRYPDNWKNYGDGNAVTIAPDGGIVQDQKSGSGAVAYGMIVAVFTPSEDPGRTITLESATDKLVDDLRRSNPNMQAAQSRKLIRVDGQRAFLTVLSNESPVGGREYDWLVTVLSNKTLLYFVGVAQEAEFDVYAQVFQAMIDSVQLAR